MEIESQFNDLPEEALDWQPLPEIPSICVLVTHLAGAERYWIGDVAARQSSNRDREAEFKSKGRSIDELSAGLRASRRYAGEVIGNIGYEDISERRVSPRDGKEITVGWALSYALEHTAIHLGHMQIIRQLWEKRVVESRGA